MKSYINSIKNKEKLSNVTQGELWKKKLQKFKSSDVVLPLNIYYDDYEPLTMY